MSISKVKTVNGIRYEVIVYPLGRKTNRLKRRFEKKVDAEKFYIDFKSKKDEIKHSHLPDIKTPEETSLEDEIQFFLEKRSSAFSAGYWRHLNPALKEIRAHYGHFTLSKITPALMDDFRVYLKSRGAKTATQNRYTQVVQRIVNFSYANDRISYNPLKRFKQLKEIPVELTTWDESEIKIFLSFGDQKYPSHSNKRWIFLSYLLALETGARANEIWGLQAQDVQWSANLIQIKRQWSGSLGYTPTKGRDHRSVPMSSVLAAELRLMLGDNTSPHGPVFKTLEGTPVDHNNFAKRVFLSDLRASGVRPLRFHDLRHTAITLLVRNGVSPWVVQKIAGHKDMKTTMRYVHIAGKDVQEVGKSRNLFVQNTGQVLSLFG